MTATHLHSETCREIQPSLSGTDSAGCHADCPVGRAEAIAGVKASPAAVRLEAPDLKFARLRREAEEAKDIAADWLRRRWAKLAELIHDDARHIEDEAREIMGEYAAEPGGPPIYEQIIDRLRDEIAELQEARDAATDRAQSWKNLCDKYKELADARGEALQRGKP